jgi:hypothetical protein
MKGIFVSYRREDSAGHAGRLFDRLAERFGKDTVFMDVEGIGPGTRFAEVIEKAVGACDVFLAVIGRHWLDCKDREGRRRLDDPQDFIRLETGSALARNVRVIPVLVEGASLPQRHELPEELQELTERQAIELRDTHWNDDIEALIAKLEPGAKPPPRASRTTRIAMTAGALLALAALLLNFYIDPGDVWFAGYLVAGLVMVVLLWLVLENVKGPDQRTGVLTMAAAFVLVAIMVAVWGYYSGGILQVPGANYVAYILLGFARVVASFVTIFSRADTDNRVFVCSVWVAMGLLFLAVRLVWAILARPLG